MNNQRFNNIYVKNSKSEKFYFYLNISLGNYRKVLKQKVYMLSSYRDEKVMFMKIIIN